MNYDPIPPPVNCPNCITRGTTHLENATISGGRIFSVQMTINSMVTDSAAITEVIAHEFGHTFGLADCDFPSCPVGSSVMEAGAPVSSANSLVCAPGPISCDIAVVLSIAPDYLCPPPSPPPSDPPPDCPPDNGDPQPICFRNCPSGCPSLIVMDLDGGGFFLTDAGHGVFFDIKRLRRADANCVDRAGSQQRIPGVAGK